MIVYHGSDIKIENIDLTKCRPHRDFGRGFYVTKFRKHAESMAKNMGRKRNNEGVVTEFEYYESAFARHICKIKHFENYNGEWLDFVVLNRNVNNSEPTHSFDIVEGPVADDKIQNRIANYLTGEITKADFLEELKWHEETHQICFCTDGALQALKKTGDQKQTSTLLHIGEPIVEKLVIDSGMDDKTAADTYFSSNTFSKLADASTGLYEKPWQEIYDMLKKEKEGDTD
jgi:hypothetical protein